MARHRVKTLLLASACLGGVALTVAGCATGSYSHHGRDNAQGPRQTGEQEVAQSRDPNSDAYVGNVPPSLQTDSKSTAPATTYRYGSANSTVVMPATTVYATNYTPTTSSTVYVPASPTTTTTVFVPAGTTMTNGTTVLVPSSSMQASAVVPTDVNFMSSAAQFNATEIELSQVAYQRAQSSAVRDFAMDTIAAHRRMAGELDNMARNRSVVIPFSPSPAGNSAVSRLSGLSGWEVDRYYLDQVIADHQAASALYGAESSQAMDVTIRSTAGGDSVDIRNRVDQAQRLRTQIN